MKKKIIFTAVILVLCYVSIGHGDVIGGSHLPGAAYPKFSAYAPTKPSSKNPAEADQYHTNVANYVREAEEYINDAINDIKRIKEAIEEARDQANDVIDGYNGWVGVGD